MGTLTLHVYYPRFREHILAYQTKINLPKSEFKYRHWPKIVKNKWPLWVERILLKKKETLLATGIYQTVHLSQYQVESYSNLIPSALCFWNSIFNHFQFQFGPIGPIILDICHILGFFSHGEDAHPYMVESDSPNIKIDPKSLGYTNFLTSQMHTSAIISNT